MELKPAFIEGDSDLGTLSWTLEQPERFQYSALVLETLLKDSDGRSIVLHDAIKRAIKSLPEILEDEDKSRFEIGLVYAFEVV